MDRNSNPNNHNCSETSYKSPATTSSDFALQWGNSKRLRCRKFQVKNRNNNDSSGSEFHPGRKTEVRVVTSDPNIMDLSRASNIGNNNRNSGNGGNDYFNLRRGRASPSQRILRNSESSVAMRGQSNGLRGLASPDKDKKGNNGSHHHHHSNGSTIKNNNGNNDEKNNSNINGSASSDSKKGGGTSSGSDAIPAVWPPKFEIALTNKEKEEDFMAIKGSKLPQRPKKRAKCIQRTLNLVSPGAWLCDLTLERYEVREKKVSKKRLRGLRVMGNIDSGSE